MQNTMTRRRFIQTLVVIGSSLVPAAPSQADNTGTWLNVGPVAKFKPDAQTKIELADHYHTGELYISGKPDGSCHALSGRCTHRGCLVDWNAKDKQFVCPCHGARYDAEGRTCAGPVKHPLTELATKVDAAGQLFVLVS